MTSHIRRQGESDDESKTTISTAAGTKKKPTAKKKSAEKPLDPNSYQIKGGKIVGLGDLAAAPMMNRSANGLGANHNVNLRGEGRSLMSRGTTNGIRGYTARTAPVITEEAKLAAKIQQQLLVKKRQNLETRSTKRVKRVDSDQGTTSSSSSEEESDEVEVKPKTVARRFVVKSQSSSSEASSDSSSSESGSSEEEVVVAKAARKTASSSSEEESDEEEKAPSNILAKRAAESSKSDDDDDDDDDLLGIEEHELPPQSISTQQNTLGETDTQFVLSLYPN